MVASEDLQKSCFQKTCSLEIVLHNSRYIFHLLRSSACKFMCAESAEEMGKPSQVLSVPELSGGFVNDKRFIGTVVTVNPDGYGFLGAQTIIAEDGGSAGLGEHDVFVHQDESGAVLKVGLVLNFSVGPDAKRGGGFYRAIGAVEHVEVECIPADELPVPGLAVRAPLSIVPSPTAINRDYIAKMKAVPGSTVEKVGENAPMGAIREGTDVPPPVTAEDKRTLCERYLAYLFPTLASFDADFSLRDTDDSAFDEKVAQIKQEMQGLGLTGQIPLLEEEIGKFRRVRGTLSLIWEEDLVRPDAIIPVRFLPDLFMACPVWYFWTNGPGEAQARGDWQASDPLPHESVQYFCELFPNERWRDVYQMFNRRLRTMQMYAGENIPAHVIRRMRRAVSLFDYVVIMTPYHDVAGRDWEDLEWLRAIDPYVVGFHKGLNEFFVLGRFSGNGTFPLLNELVGDTIEFLRKNKGNLSGFDQVTNPYWWQGPRGEASTYQLGARLMRRTDELLTAFDAGQLFAWLKGEADVATTAK